MIFGTVGAFAGQYIATENTFPVQLNGKDVAVDGYNIDGSTYFKLRDIANVIGGFDVDFSDNTIQLSKDGYEYTKLNYSYVDKDYNFSLEIPHEIQNKYVITTDTNSNDYLKVIRFYEKNNYEYPIDGEYHVGTVFNIYICDKIICQVIWKHMVISYEIFRQKIICMYFVQAHLTYRAKKNL